MKIQDPGVQYSEKSHGIALLHITDQARVVPYLMAHCSDLATGGFRFMF